MIDPKDKLVQALVEQGYRLALHAYLQPSGRVKYTFVAKHKTGKVVQGWSGSGSERDALVDLVRRAGMIT